MTNREEQVKRALQLMDAFPPEEPAIPITGLVGEVESETARSVFRVCRLCGALVLDSMTTSHIMTINHDRSWSPKS